jgi:hypothetical protein
MQPDLTSWRQLPTPQSPLAITGPLDDRWHDGDLY